MKSKKRAPIDKIYGGFPFVFKDELFDDRVCCSLVYQAIHEARTVHLSDSPQSLLVIIAQRELGRVLYNLRVPTTVCGPCSTSDIEDWAVRSMFGLPAVTRGVQNYTIHRLDDLAYLIVDSEFPGLLDIEQRRLVSRVVREVSAAARAGRDVCRTQMRI